MASHEKLLYLLVWEFITIGCGLRQSLKSTGYFYGKVTDKIKQRFVWSTVTLNESIS